MATKRYKVDGSNLFDVAEDSGMSADRLAKDYIRAKARGRDLYVEVEEEDE